MVLECWDHIPTATATCANLPPLTTSTPRDCRDPVNLGSTEMVSMNEMMEMVKSFESKDLRIKNIPGAWQRGITRVTAGCGTGVEGEVDVGAHWQLLALMVCACTATWSRTRGHSERCH